MPSDAKKREQQRKKEQAKARQAGKKVATKNGEENDKEQSPAPNQTNGVKSNGTTELSAEGIIYY